MENTSIAKRNDYLETYTGMDIDVVNPDPTRIIIEDIAHALSNICRYGGHSSYFYSVGQHSIIVSREIERLGYGPGIQLYGLLHDASEAYICDIPRPTKKNIIGYLEMETNMQNTIYKALDIEKPDTNITNIVTIVDYEVLQYEARRLMKKHSWAKDNCIKIDADIKYMPMKEVKKEFLKMYEKLKNIT